MKEWNSNNGITGKRKRNGMTERKNINRGFKKLRVWQDAISLYIVSCNIFAHFRSHLKRVAANSIDAAHSISRNIAGSAP